MKWKQMQPWQQKKIARWFLFYVIVGIAFLTFVVSTLVRERNEAEVDYYQSLQNDAHAVELRNAYAENATEVLLGTYVESVKEISIKNSNFRIVFQAWFRWEGNDEIDFSTSDSFRVYNGITNSFDVIKNTVTDDGIHYQKIRVDATVTRAFNTTRFPLGANVLRFYIEPNKYLVDQVVFEPDTANSGVNKNLSISGFSLVKNNVAEHIVAYPNTMNNPTIQEARTTSEVVTVLELKRDGFGLYLRCFIALIGTTAWVMLAMYVCANHHVNPLGTMAATLFGTVSNMMICANLQPDTIELGLAEFVNAWGILTILGGTICIIQTNRIRETTNDTKYSKYFGRVMFWTLLCLCVVGHIIMPLSAWM